MEVDVVSQDDDQCSLVSPSYSGDIFLMINGFQLVNVDSLWKYLLQIVWVAQVVALIIFGVGSGLFCMFYYFPSWSARICFVYGVIFVQLLSLVPILVYEKYTRSYMTYVTRTNKILISKCFEFFIVNILMFIVSCALMFVVFEREIPFEDKLLKVFTLYPNTFAQSLALYFTLLRLHAAKDISDQFLSQMMSGELSFHRFTQYREDIRSIALSSQWAVFLVVSVAILNSIAMVIDIILYGKIGLKELFLLILGDLCLYGREALMLLYTIPIIVGINESSLAVNVELGNKIWNFESDPIRVNILLSNMNDPLRFTIGGIRLTRLTVLTHIIGLSLSFAIAVIRGLLLSQ